jgi:branched-chain amino acid transport system permease protein
MVTDPSFWLVQGLNSLQLAMLLFLLSVGLTVIFGLMNFVNLAHGSLYALGALIGYSIADATGSAWWAYLLTPIAVAAIGALLYATLIERLRTAGPLPQVLVTFGLIFVLIDAQRYIWGTDALGVTTGVPFSHTIHVLGEPYPAYRLFIIAVGLTVFAALHLLLNRTRLGAEVRAGVDDSETASALGVPVERTFFLVFLLGCALAGLAGAVAMPAFSAEAGMGVEILVPTLVVVVVGGLGSLKGALVGSLVIGATLTFGTLFFPAFAGIAMYAALVVVLLLRPHGLFPARS